MAALLAACNGDEGSTLADNGERVSLCIVAGIDAEVHTVTRAVDTSWEEGDQIGVFVTEHSSSSLYKDLDDTEGDNLPYSFDDGSNYETWGNTYRLFTPTSQKIYLPSSSVDVYGYYPYKQSSALTYKSGDPKTVPSIFINVYEQNPQKDIDLMRARTGNVNNSSTAIRLLFYHRLVKLVFNLKQGDGLLPDELQDASSVYLTMSIDHQPIEAKYDIYNDAFEITPGNNTIYPVVLPSAPVGYVSSFEAIVLPNGTNNPASSDRTVTIEFYQKDTDPIVNKFTIGTTFEAGHKYTYNVTVNAVSVTVDSEKYTEQW